MARLTRRSLLKGAAAAPLAGAASMGGALQAAGQTPASKFTLSVNLELMFPRQMPYAERIAVAADQGCTAFSFWEIPPHQAAAMEGAQRRYGLKCGSITGNGKTGWSTGLTRTGFESAFLEDFKAHIEVAKRFNVKNLVCFLGVTQKEISLAVQHAQVIEGLKKVGDIAARNDVYFCLEPLSIVHHPGMSVHTARRLPHRPGSQPSARPTRLRRVPRAAERGEHHQQSPRGLAQGLDSVRRDRCPPRPPGAGNG